MNAINNGFGGARRAIREVVAGRTLGTEAAYEVASAVMAEHATPAQIAGLLVGLRMKGEHVDELYGFARAVRMAMTPLPLSGVDLVDTCGTEGDGAGTFNISTAAAFVAAGAGCRVAKHGNRAVSSSCGSADVLEALGIPIDASADRAAACIEQIGIGFLFAPSYHAPLRVAAGPRRDLGVRTLFNLIGPLVNPARVRQQVIGVFDESLTEPVAEVLRRLSIRRALVVHGHDGLDEFSVTGPTRVTDVTQRSLRTYMVEPGLFGMRVVDIRELAGGDAPTNCDILLSVLGGAAGAARDIVLLNAAAAICVSGIESSLSDAVDRARYSIDSGQAARKLAMMKQFLNGRSR
jgi:anthranilate phosphoribosyltransferase